MNKSLKCRLTELEEILQVRNDSMRNVRNLLIGAVGTPSDLQMINCAFFS